MRAEDSPSGRRRVCRRLVAGQQRRDSSAEGWRGRPAEARGRFRRCEHSLLARDFKASQLPAGSLGPRGAAGPQGSSWSAGPGGAAVLPGPDLAQEPVEVDRALNAEKCSHAHQPDGV